MKLNWKMWLVTATTLLGTSAHAAGICDTSWSEFQSRLKETENRLAFTNSGGPMNIGVCWWHSRMQRNANFLLDFKAAGQMTKNETWTVIKNLSRNDKVQTVKGFSNLADFSGTYYNEMTEALGQWQMSDSFFKMGWTNGIGKQIKDARSLQKEMDALYIQVNSKKNVEYQMLKMEGFAAHAWLVIDMQKTPTGYNLEVLDSNYTSVQTYEYTRGQKSFYYYGMSEFAPTSQRQSELAVYKKAIKNACGSKGKVRLK